jgi:hypothetical protein
VGAVDTTGMAEFEKQTISQEIYAKTPDALALSSPQNFKFVNISQKIFCSCQGPQPIPWAGLQTALVEREVSGVTLRQDFCVVL